MSKFEVEVSVIEVKINRIEQLFNSFDPSPFDERDLDKDAEEHITGWARELPQNNKICIVVSLPPHEAQRAQERNLASALTHYFKDRAGWLNREIKELFRVGWGYFLIGLMVLIVCLGASHVIPRIIGEGTMTSIIKESLIILGWVANWKPLETFLYDWLPLKRRAKLYLRLAQAKVEIRSS